MELATSTRDARGRLLQEGDEVLLIVRAPVPFRVTQIAPALDPKMPPNHVIVTVQAVQRFLAPRDSVNQEFIRVATVDEIRAATPPPADEGSV